MNRLDQCRPGLLARATEAFGLDDRVVSSRGRIGFAVKDPETYTERELQLVAHLYYKKQLSQKNLAAFLNTSQARISRMLMIARERGIVQFLVQDYQPREESLERQLAIKFPLSNVAVIKTPPGSTPENNRKLVAHFGSPIVTSLISPHSNVVVAGGRTISELVRMVPEDPQRAVTVLQALGMVDSQIEHVDAFELGRMLARLWGGYFVRIQAPAIAPDRRSRDMLLREAVRGSACDGLRRADAAIVAIGTPTNSVFANRYICTSRDLSELAHCGAVGEICGRFFDAAGRECESPWRDRVISIPLEELRRVPQVVGVVAGPDRSGAIAAAIRGGILKSLVIDVEGARALLQNSLRLRRI